MALDREFETVLGFVVEDFGHWQAAGQRVKGFCSGADRDSAQPVTSAYKPIKGARFLLSAIALLLVGRTS
jgi:hypothetical protein